MLAQRYIPNTCEADRNTFCGWKFDICHNDVVQLLYKCPQEISRLSVQRDIRSKFWDYDTEIM